MQKKNTLPHVRRHTICNKTFYSDEIIRLPVIRLCGKWLRDTGFKGGQVIDIICEQGKITIVRSEQQRFEGM